MKNKYYVNQAGIYIGCSEDAVPPKNGIEVPTPPNNCLVEKWDGIAWVEYLPKAAQLEKITVTTQSGKIFDGNDTAISRMGNAIMVAERIGAVESQWIMANNDKLLITLDELKEAHTLAMMRLGDIVLGS